MTRKKHVLTVGFEIADPDSKYVPFRGKTSLLDWDIVLFRPLIYEFVHDYHDTYQGKPSLNEVGSFEAKRCCEHWRREIKEAVEAGKTVIVFLPELYEVYVDTGQRTYSGTGRNQKTTRHVEKLSNYQVIPAQILPVAATGSSMKLASKGAAILSPYWEKFAESSSYQVVLSGAETAACILTRAGDKPVGAVYRSKSTPGALLLLPDVDFSPREFVKKDGASEVWTPAAIKFGGAFVSSIIALDTALRSSSDITPEPSWAAADSFALKPERALRVQLAKADRQVELARKKKEDVFAALSKAGGMRALLYENGKPLETAIIEALRVLGFTAAAFKESDSEFDVVFESAEGRLIGEAEGKDSKAINVDKLRQLSMNIHEDLQRDAVTSPAKPVLFGNGFRLQEPKDRPEPFTEKCYSAAASSSTALISTPDLFIAVQQLIDKPDHELAKALRVAIFTTTGRVKFSIPIAATNSGQRKVAP